MNELDLFFTPNALRVLNELTFDPDATNGYEHLSGGLLWSDELPKVGTPESTIVFEADTHRFLLAARASITLGENPPRFVEVWLQVEKFAPNWPGLHPERRGDRIRRRLLAAKRLANKYYEEMFDDSAE